MAENSAVEELSLMFDTYARSLPSRIDTIEMLWHKLENTWNAKDFQELHRTVHSINGSSSIYCFHELHELAKNLEAILQSITDDAQLKPQKEKITVYVKDLKKSLSATSNEQILKSFIQQNTQD